MATVCSPLSDEDLFTMPPFDPAIHLAFEPPAARHSFTELSLPVPRNAPDMCFTEPFQLFSDEGVRMIRRDLFRKELLDKHLRSWERAPAYISGHEMMASWITEAWTDPATQAAIDKATGFPLKIVPRTGEIGHVNVQLGPDGIPGVYKLTEIPSPALSPAQVQTSEFDNTLTDSWHKDMNQLACVLMLSDTSTMVGGETAIKTGTGAIIKTRGAKLGGAVIIQGGHTEHAALRATNAAERLSMVTAYCSLDPDTDDSGTTCRSLDPDGDDIPLLSNQFMLHKLDRLRGRIDIMSEKLTAQQGNGVMLKREDFEPWFKEQLYLLKSTAWELFERTPTYLSRDIPDGAIERYLSDV